MSRYQEMNGGPGPSAGIVGAGIAGLACARRLARRGFRVTVVEKARGPGGRMSTRRTDRGAFDHGAQYFTARDSRFLAQLEEWRAAGVAAEWEARLVVYRGGERFDLNDGQKRFVGVPRMSAVTRHQAEGLNLRTGWPVARVEREPDGWRFHSLDRESLGPFDGAAIAVPAPQAGPLLSGNPTLAVQAEEVRMSSCWAVMAAYSDRLDLPFDAAFTESPLLPWLARNSSKPGRGGGGGGGGGDAEAWVLHASNAWSDEHIDAEPDWVIERLLGEFDRLTGGRTTPELVRAHRWRYALPSHLLGITHLWDGDLGIGACGDWCGGSRVEGAFLSGLELADQMTESMTG